VLFNAEEGEENRQTMIKLNKAQLVACWIIILLISFLIIAPAVKVEKFYQYKSKDGWEWKGWHERIGEYIDELGNPYKVENSKAPHLVLDEESTKSKITLDGTKTKNIFDDILPTKPIRKFYYAGSYNKYSLDKGNRRDPIYPYERFAVVVVLNGILLIYSLGMIKPPKTKE